MKKFLIWCLAVLTFAISLWGIGALFVQKSLSNATAEVLAAPKSTTPVIKAFFSTNTFYTLTFIIFVLVIGLTLFHFVPKAKLRRLNNNISKHLNTATTNDSALLSSLSKLMIVAAAFFSGLLVMNLSFSFLGFQEQMGVFGDFLGGVLNPILSFLSLIAILLTIILQSKELKETRKEIKRSAEAQGKAEKALHQQAFENTFFNMLSLHNNIVQNLEFTNLYDLGEYYENRNKDCIQGRNVFAKLNTLLSHKVNLYFGDDELSYVRLNAKETASRFHILQTKNNQVLGHYFRNLYQIISFVDSYTSLTFDEKKKYLKILRSQLSSDELALLFLNGLDVAVDKGQFRRLLIRYELLKHISFGAYGNEGTIEFIKQVNRGDEVVLSIKGCFYITLEQIGKYTLFVHDSLLHSSAFGKENDGFELYKSAGLLGKVSPKQFVESDKS